MDSNWLVVAMVVAGVSLVLGPVYWLRPTSRQRQLARLRAHAVKLGLRPEFKQLPQAMGGRKPSDRMMVYFCFKHGGNWPREGEYWLAANAGGEENPRLEYLAGGESGLSRAGLADLPPLPRGVAALEAGPDGVGVYWHEAGDTDRVDDLFALLTKWAQVYRIAGATEPTPTL